MTSKNTIIFIGVLVLILFCGGVIAGYYIWGVTDGEERDFPALLREAAQHITDLEARQGDLETQLATALQATPASGDSEKPAEVAKVETPPAEVAKEETTPAEAVDDRTQNLEMQIKSLQEENAALQTALSSDKSATEKNLELTDQIQALIEAKNSTEQENSTLRSQIDQLQNLSAENEQLKSNISLLAETNSRLEKEKADLQKVGGENNRLLAEKREYEMQAQVCANEKAELEKQNAGLQAANNQNQNLMAENQNLKATIAANADEINTLKVRLNEIRAMANTKDTADTQGSAAEAENTQ